MWQYNNTIYPDDELYHWKYIRKYKKNGKWRYVYKDNKNKKREGNLGELAKSAVRDTLGLNERKELSDVKNKYENAVSKYQEARRGAYQIIEDHTNAPSPTRYEDWPEFSDKFNEALEKAQRDEDYWEERADKHYEEAREIYDRYSKTVLGKIDKTARKVAFEIDIAMINAERAGKNFVNSILKKFK